MPVFEPSELTMTCPVCERQARQRLTPLSETQMQLTYQLMVERGWSADALLEFRRPELDWLCPGLTRWLQAHINDPPHQPAALPDPTRTKSLRSGGASG